MNIPRLETHTLMGTTQDDLMFGDWGNDWMMGYEGDDLLFGNSESDSIHGGVGDDSLYGGHSNDLLHGEIGSDFLFGDLGDDTLLGGEDDDVLFGESGNDFLDGGDGNDTLTGASVFIDSFNQIDTLIGGEGEDVFEIGGAGRIFYGANGDSDYAFIADFNPDEDVIQADSLSLNYSLVEFSRPELGSGTGIYININPMFSERTQDLIAFVAGVTPDQIADRIL